MENQLSKALNDYLKEIDIEKFDSIWKKQSSFFRDFWKTKIMDKYPPLTDAEIDEVVLIFDKNAKGSTKDTIAIARIMISQGVWRRLFKEIQKNKTLKDSINSILTEEDENKQIDHINELYKLNEGQKNSLTGKSGNAINTMLFAYDPVKYLAVISVNDRKKIIDYFHLDCSIDFEKDSPGEKIVLSNKAILEGFKNYCKQISPYNLSKFFYRKLKDEWKPSGNREEEITEELVDEENLASQSTFYMEKELENFIISNWDKTELSKEYELIEEDGEVVSQQYRTSIGIIDILVKDKKTKQYVVIELKKNQTSDDTIGQLTRYMGWIEENKSPKISTKGIIIASAYDNKLYYALKKVKDVEVYTYQISFKLTEFKGNKR